MILIIFLLIVASLVGGISVQFLGSSTQSIRYPLIFAGSFLFSITIIHIIPEVFVLSHNPMRVSLFILIGFFFQQFLEYFTSGIEHGHFHVQDQVSSGSKVGLILALVVHSLLEGALLNHQSPFHEQNESFSVLFGIILHKIPAAFALMATLRHGSKFTPQLWFILLVFTISSPLGLVLSNEVLNLSSENLLLLFAIVSGSFLHISTTIFVETSPNHHFGFRKFAVSLLGAGIAIATEHFL